MHLFPSVAVSVEEVEDVILIEAESRDKIRDMDPVGAIQNTPVSLMLIVWILHL